MEIWAYIVPFAYLILIESLVVRWVAGGTVHGLFSRIFATNLAGVALLMFISLTGWFLGWWPDIRNWALRDSFFLFFIIKAPIFGFLFRRWGLQRIFTLHVLSNFASVIALSVLFVFTPWVLAISPTTVDDLNETARQRVLEIRDAVERYKITHGYYPNYIWGGDMVSWGTQGSPDPLISEGYLNAYPVNPFNLRRTFFEPRREPGLRELWFGFKDETFLITRTLWAPIVEDPRFGYRGGKMGNVLPDPRMPETKLPQDVRFTIDFKWMPGGFFYRSIDLDGNGFAEAYIMGVCGIESAQATVDCYNHFLDRLTRDINGHIAPSAHDRKRDGVIYIVRQGFPEITAPPSDQPVRRIEYPRDPETGEVIPQPWMFVENLSAGQTEPVVSPSVENDEGNVE